MAWNTSAQLYMREQPCFRKRLVFLKLIYFIRTNNHILTKLMLSWTIFLVLVGVNCYLLFKIFEKRLYNIFWTANATDFIHLILESSTMESKNCPSPTALINFLAVSLLDCFSKNYVTSLWVWLYNYANVFYQIMYTYGTIYLRLFTHAHTVSFKNTRFCQV